MKKQIFALGFVAMMFASCATIVSGSKQTIKIDSTPSSAVVLVDGKEIGKTPLTTKLTRKENHKVRIQLEGYQPYEVELTKKFNEWYIGNVVFGGLIGLVVDPITGAIYRLTPKEINTELQKGMAFKTSENEIYIAVSLRTDQNWQKVGQLEKL